jgi:hypothetical protein
MNLGMNRQSDAPPSAAPSHLTPTSFRALVLFLAGGATASVAWIISSRRFLFADASNFLLKMWVSKSFILPSPGRWFGSIASQWMPVLAMKAGWRDLAGITALYGLNLWINPVLAIAAIWYASRRSAETTMVAMVLVLLLFQTTYAVIESEASVFFLLAIVFFTVVVRRDFPVVGLFLVIPLTFTHEVLVLAFVPALALLLIKKKRMSAHYGEARYWGLVTALFFPAVFSTFLILNSPGANRSGLVRGALEFPWNRTIQITSVAFLALSLSAFRPQNKWIAWLFGLSSLALLMHPFLEPEWLDPNSHYRFRALNGVLAASFFAYLYARTHGHLAAPKALPVRRFMVLAAVVFVYQGKSTWEWSRHLALFRTALTERPGVRAFPVGSPLDARRSRQFLWGWTTPTRSVVFQAIDNGEIGAIMENRNPRIWQPFSPHDPQALPDLSAYGVRYLPEVLEQLGTNDRRRGSTPDTLRLPIGDR